jgi:hypothetical protein
MSENTQKNDFLRPLVKDAQILSKTDLFQIEFPLFFSLILLAKKGSRFLEVSTKFVLCLNLPECPMHKQILPYVLAHIPENNPP